MPRVEYSAKKGLVETPNAGGFYINGEVVTATGAELNQIVLTTHLTNISASSEAFVVTPHAGTLTTVYSVIDGPISSGNATLTVKAGGSTLGTITVTQAGSAARDVDSLTGLSTALVAGQAIEVESDGGSSTSCKANLTFLIER